MRPDGLALTLETVDNLPDIRSGWLCVSTPVMQDLGSPPRNWSFGHREQPLEVFMQATGSFVLALARSFPAIPLTIRRGFRLIMTSAAQLEILMTMSLTWCGQSSHVLGGGAFRTLVLRTSTSYPGGYLLVRQGFILPRVRAGQKKPLDRMYGASKALRLYCSNTNTGIKSLHLSIWLS